MFYYTYRNYYNIEYMKLPEVIFVKHCPDLAPERKVFLEKHLKERVLSKMLGGLKITTMTTYLYNG